MITLPRIVVCVRVCVLLSACLAAAQTKSAPQTKPAPASKVTLEQAASRTGRDSVPTYEGKEVVVTGQVSTKPIWITDSYYVAVQDAAFFGLMLRPEIPQLPDLTPGDWVEAQGTISKRAGLPILLPHTVRRLRHADAPAPKAVTTLDLTSFRYMGVLVTLESVITGENQNGGGDLLLIGQKNSELNVFLPRTRRDTGPQLSGFRLGDRIRVTGIASQYCTLPPYDRYFQILIPGPASTAVIERGWAIQPPVLLASIILAGALAVIWWFREQRMSALRKQMRLLHSLGEQVIGATSSTEILRRLILNLPALSNATGVGLYIHNRAMKTDRLDYLKHGLRNASSGKGVSETQAKASALCEAVERYSGELTGGELRVTRALRDWKDREAYHPNDVMLYSARQYAEREACNKKDSRFNRVPEPLDENAPIDWTPLWSLTAQRHRYLPTQLVYYRAPALEGDNICYSMGCSNGNAAGNTLEEAILQGFFELVERDAVALWWYNRLRKPGVAVDTFGEPYLLELAEHYRRHCQRATWALDLTTDLGIPVFVAASKMMEGKEERLLFGLGCHLDARIALQRAFAEMNQMLAMAHTGEGGELSLEDGETLEWLRHATVANQPYMAADPDRPFKRFGDYPMQHSGEFLQDIDHCRSIVEAQDMEMLVLDQTRADVGMPVVKVVVPGLRHFWPRYAPGRLYEVPVKMGWLEKPLREDELNPISIFF